MKGLIPEYLEIMHVLVGVSNMLTLLIGYFVIKEVTRLIFWLGKKSVK